MRATLTLVLMLLLALAGGAYAGQVVTATFEELAGGTYVGDRYPGAFVDGYVYADGYQHQLDLSGNYGRTVCRFPNGVLWFAFHGWGDYTAAAYSVDNVRLASVGVESWPDWQLVEWRLGTPISYVTVSPVDRKWGSPIYINDISYEIAPEPASAASLATGLVGLAGLVWRRRGQRKGL